MTKNNTHTRNFAVRIVGKIMVGKPSMKAKPMMKPKKKKVGAFALFKAPMEIA